MIKSAVSDWVPEVSFIFIVSFENLREHFRMTYTVTRFETQDWQSADLFSALEVFKKVRAHYFEVYFKNY